MFANLLVLVCSLIPFFLPWIAIGMEMNILFLLGRYLSTVSSGSLGLQVVFQTSRELMDVLVVVEACNCFRILGLNTFILFRGLQSCHALLISQSVRENVLSEQRHLSIIFSLVRDLVAFLFSVDLGMTIP